MKTKSLLTTLCATLVIGAFAAKGFQVQAPSATKRPAFYIAEFEVTDREALKPYSARVESTFKPFGGRFVVRGGTIAPLAAAMTHIAVQEEIDGTNAAWMEKVSDEQYGHRPSTSKGAKNMSKEPSAIKKTFGDFAPKLVQLTDDVLFGDVWERAELSKRDRSLVTVAALIAGGNTEQLPFHLNRAKENGLTETELVEAITHLAFYSGWPKAMSAITVAKEVFKR
jgi:alkylhydroperoxidase/carboxymuconolactone decarboxylase family protein YurZ/uncharacterized protein (DUF1330 family)